jgi:hypothetical protein
MELMMYYVCLEDFKIISILNYEPEVPLSVSVFTITENEYECIKNQTHYFDIFTKKVLSVSKEIIDQKEIDQKNSVEREFLNSTDWMVLRHLRQKYLEIQTSLSEEEYKDLEIKRHQAASRIT